MIPLWAISGLASAAVAGFVGYQACAYVKDAKLARVEAAYAQERIKAAELSGEKEREYRAKETQARAEQARSIEVANEQIDNLQVALRAERNSAIGLRSQFAAFAAESARAAESGATEFQRQAAQTARDVQVRVLSRLDGAASELAEWADRAHIAGLACEREHAVAVR